VIQSTAFVAVSSLVLLAGCSTETERSTLSQRRENLSNESFSYYVVLKGEPAASLVSKNVDQKTLGDRTRARVEELTVEHAVLRPELEKRGAQIVFEYTRVGNAFQVRATEENARRLSELPEVLRIERVPVYQALLGSALPVAGAPQAWAMSTPYQGDGVTIGIVDSGIDYTHADFGGPGTPAAYLANDSTVVEPGSFPTAKVVGGWDFVGDDYDAENEPVPIPDADPLDCTKPQSFQISGGHGTHVSGIASGVGVTNANKPFAGSYAQSFNPGIFQVAPGVAPKAMLYALKIFGCDGGTDMLGAAVERAADPNQDGNFDDHLDVVNASLGTAYSLSSLFNDNALANLAKVGTLFVAAAGNEGQNFYDASSPGTTPSVLSVAASADNEFLALEVLTPATAAKKIPAAEGGFTTRLADTGAITGELVQVSPANGCNAFSNAAAVNGKIALMDRGNCPFVQKFENAIAAGAVAGVVVDNELNSLPLAMSGGDPGSVSIPGVLVLQSDGNSLKSSVAQGTVTIKLDPAAKYNGVGSELLASFSSRGPSARDNRLKPEIAAPGFAIDSARVGSGFEARRSDGTSMASPFVAGAAALVRQAKPEYTPAEVKAALVNSTEPISDLNGVVYGSSIVGSGRLAVERAVGATVTAGADFEVGDIGVSFGSLIVADPVEVKKTVQIRNHGTAAVTLTASIDPNHDLPGVSVTVAPTSVTIEPDVTATVELTLTLDPQVLGAPGPDPGTDEIQYDNVRQYLNEATGLLRLVPDGGGQESVVPYLGSVRAAGHSKADTTGLCGQARTPGEPVSIPRTGETAHPQPVVTAFELGTLDPAIDTSDPLYQMQDIRAVGVATNLATAESFEEASVYFGVAIAGEWITPARGQISVVSVEVDPDQNGASDFEIRAEPLTATGPFADLLVARTYVIGSDQPVGDPRFLNMVDAATASTNPFGNSVMVLTARLADIGVNPDNPVFEYSAVSLNPNTLQLGEHTISSTFDAAHPRINTAFGLEGRPIYIGDEPMKVAISAEAQSSGEPLDVLLLHHTNVAGERFEILNLGENTGNVALSATAPASVDVGQNATVNLEVKNSAANATSDTKLHALVTGGTVVSVEPAQGTCAASAGDDIDCTLGSIAAGASVSISVVVKGADASTEIEIDSDIEPGITCESLLEDNQVEVKVAIGGSSPKGDKGNLRSIEPGGGCGCRTTPESSDAGWLAAALSALMLARRRRKSADS
jgi:MYXO-CTERM domain-containing protein